MVEDKLWNGTRIVLAINAAASAVFMLIFLILPETLIPLLYGSWNSRCVTTERQLGAIFLGVIIIAFISLKKGEWPPIKLFMEFGILVLLFFGALGIEEMAVDGPSTGSAITLVIILALAAINIFAYFKEEKLHKSAK